MTDDIDRELDHWLDLTRPATLRDCAKAARRERSVRALPKEAWDEDGGLYRRIRGLLRQRRDREALALLQGWEGGR